MQKKLFGIVTVCFDATGRLLIVYSAFVSYLRKKMGTQYIPLFTHLKNGYDSVRKEVLCNNHIKFGIRVKPARLITAVSEWNV
jgi:hypothetical protein